MSRKKILIIAAVLVTLFIVSCTAGPNEMVKVANEDGDLAGFFMGLWHGFILLFSFIVSLFNSEVNVYEVHNVGPLYNLGYLIGVSMFFSGSGHASNRKKRRDRC